MFSRQIKALSVILILMLILPAAGFGQADDPPRLEISEIQPEVESVVDASEITKSSLELDQALRSDSGKLQIIVELKEPPLALYDGSFPGLDPTNPQVTGDVKLDVQADESQAYLAFLDELHEAFEFQLTNIAPGAEVLARYRYAFNGFALALNERDVDRIAELRGVRRIYADTLMDLHMDASLPLIDAADLWTAAGGQANAGAGVKVAVVDSGIRPENPMFDGTGFSAPAGYPRGYCVTDDPTFCNEKLLVTRWYAPPTGYDTSVEVMTPLDINGHGSHTAGTSAGNPVTVPPGAVTTNTDISGVAPAAYLMAYKAFFHMPDGGASGSTSSILLALDDVLYDGADVVNNSWGGGPGDPAESPYLTAIQALNAAGTVVVFSAGNAGPDAGTVGCPGCVEEAITVAASTTTRTFENTFDVIGPTPVPDTLETLKLREGSGPPIPADIETDLIYSGDVDPLNIEGCSAFPADSFLGAIAHISRGSCTFATKVTNAADAGALAAIIYNNAGDEFINMGGLEATTIPSFFMGQTNGEAVRDWILANTGTAIGRIYALPTEFSITPDVLASFSSVGPNGDPNILKPDITAPGVNILSAYSPALAGADFDLVSGTSMAAPHIAGSAALLKQIHPTWTPAQIKTVLTSTATQDVLQPDESTPATYFQRGAGRVNLGAVANAGVTFETPSFASGACLLSCSWSNSIENVTGGSLTWTASIDAPAGMGVTLTPDAVTLPANLKQDFDLVIDVTSLEASQWYFASITWEESTGTYPDAFMPIAVYVSPSSDAFVLSKTAHTSTIRPHFDIHYTVDLLNKFPDERTFYLRDPIPANAEYVMGSAATTNGTIAYNASESELQGEVTLQGFSYSISNVASPYGYVSLSSLGVTPLVCSTDCDEVIVNISGLDFMYGGQQYTSLGMVSNGYMIPGGGTASDVDYINQDLPDSTPPNNVIAPFWTDIDMAGGVTGGGTWYIAAVGLGPDYLVLEWEDAELYADPSSYYTFQIWIEWGGSGMWFVYHDLTGSLAYATVGIENATGTAGATYYFDGTGTAPAVGTDLQPVGNPDSAAFTYDMTAIGGPDSLVTNVVEVTQSGSGELFSAWASTLIEWYETYLPHIAR